MVGFDWRLEGVIDSVLINDCVFCVVLCGSLGEADAIEARSEAAPTDLTEG